MLCQIPSQGGCATAIETDEDELNRQVCPVRDLLEEKLV